MKIKIRNSQDFCSGMIFILFGLVALVVARAYPMGTALRMGPGYFPKLLGGILFLLGLVVAVRSLWVTGEVLKSFAIRPLALILAAVLVFAFLVERFGLVFATFGLVIVSSLGGQEFRLRETLVLALMLVALTVGLFVYGLGLPFSIWPT